MPKIEVVYTQFELKKHSVRMKTDERLGGNWPLPDQYVNRAILAALGVHGQAQDNPNLKVTISYSIEDAKPRS